MKNLFLALILLPMLFTGCNGKTQISGTVTYKDGSPVYPGKVCFGTEKHTYYGRLDKDGHYSVGEFKDGEGIIPGKYDVWLAETGYSKEIIRNGKPTGLYDSYEKVDAKYTAPNTDGLKYELKSGGAKTFDITVEKPLKEKQ